MPTLDSPLKLSPVFKLRIWGRRDLAPLFSRGVRATRRAARPGPAPPLPDQANDGLIGEVWLTDGAARFLNGPVAGMTLAEASQKFGMELHGKSWKGARFPILAKYIFTSDWLSVQVHPDDNFARERDPGNLGKCEMWYIVRAERRAKFLLGLKPGISKERLRAESEKGNSKELLQRFQARAGEAVFVPPGTVHALGPGLVLFEAEENSDLTYRLDDFGRMGLDGKPRPLHWDNALEVIRPELPALRNLPRLEFREPYGSRRYVLASRFFAVEELALRKASSFQGSTERVEVLSVIQGGGRVETAAGWLGYRAGDTWLIPPAAGKYRLAPGERTRFLKCYVPDLDEDFRKPLAARGVRAARIDKVVFD